MQDNGQDVHLIMTGGEPLFAWQRFYIELFEHPRMQDLKNVTFETNTTQKLHEDFRTYLNNQGRFKVIRRVHPTVIHFWRILGICESDPDIVSDYNSISNSDLYLKFVVADTTDIDEVHRAVDEYKEVGIESSILCPLGGRSEEYNLNVKQVAEVCMERG